MNESANDRRALYFSLVLFPNRPLHSSFGTINPKICPISQPVVLIFARDNRLLVRKQFSRDLKVTAVIADKTPDGVMRSVHKKNSPLGRVLKKLYREACRYLAA